MKSITIREAREGLSHPEQMFAGNEEVIVTRRGEPVARILPIKPVRPMPSHADLRARMQPLTTATAELIRAERDER